MNHHQNTYSFFWWTCLVFSKLDLVAFQDQVKDPWTINKMEETAIHPGTCQWVEQMTQMQGTSIVEEVILRHVVWEDLLLRKWFWMSLGLFLSLSWRVISCPSLDSLYHFCISLQWIIFTFTVRTRIPVLAWDKWHELMAPPLSHWGGFRKNCVDFWVTILSPFKSSVSSQKSVGGVVNKLPNFWEYWGQILFVFYPMLSSSWKLHVWSDKFHPQILSSLLKTPPFSE